MEVSSFNYLERLLSALEDGFPTVVSNIQIMEEVGLPAKVYGTVDHICLDVGEFLPGGSSGGAAISIVDVGDVSMHWEDAGHISKPGNTTTDW